MPAAHSHTPSSERSLYFDAPIAIFDHSDNMSTSQEALPPAPPPDAAPVLVTFPTPVTAPPPVQLYDDGPVPEEPKAVVETPERRKSLVEHPNGSEGWLPTEEPAPKQRIVTPIPPAAPTTETQETQAAAVQSPKINEELPIQTEGELSRGGLGAVGILRTSSGTASKKDQSLGRSSSRRSEYTTTDSRGLGGSAFVNGAGTTGPMATVEEDEALRARAAEAHDNLSPKQRAKVAKEESKNEKRLSKIIRQEGKTEKQSLDIMINELEDLQKVQRNAVKSEAQVQANHSKLLASFKKKEALYLNAKRNYEKAGAELNAEGETLEALRTNARDATARMQDKAAEVDSLRKTLAVDNREREVKLAQLGGGKRGGFWKD